MFIFKQLFSGRELAPWSGNALTLALSWPFFLALTGLLYGQQINFATQVVPLFSGSGSCTSCHGGGSPSGGMNLTGTADQIYFEVVQETSTRTVVNNPTTSTILTKPSRTVSHSSFTQALPTWAVGQTSYQTTLQWIQQGAARTPVALSRNPTSLNFSARVGAGNPPNQTLQISNSGGGMLNWSVSDNQTWLTLSPSSGSSTGETDNVSVNVAIAGLTAGTYTATITIAGQTSGTAPFQLPSQSTAVTLNLSPPVGVEEKNTTGIPTQFNLEQNFPNPFWSGAASSARSGGNLSTQMAYALPERGRVTLVVSNLAGQTVRVLVDEQKPAGRHLATWDGRDQAGNMLPSGVYFYILATGKMRLSRKMILLQ